MPCRAVPFRSVPFRSVPLHSTPLHSIPFLHSFIHSFIHSFVICSFHSFVHSFLHSVTSWRVMSCLSYPIQSNPIPSNSFSQLCGDVCLVRLCFLSVFMISCCVLRCSCIVLAYLTIVSFVSLLPLCSYFLVCGILSVFVLFWIVCLCIPCQSAYVCVFPVCVPLSLLCRVFICCFSVSCFLCVLAPLLL